MPRLSFKRPLDLPRIAFRFGVSLAAISISTVMTLIIANETESVLAGLIGTSLTYLIATSIYASLLPRSGRRN